MSLIAVPRWKVIAALSQKSDNYIVLCVQPYNIYFTSEVDVIPLGEPDAVFTEIAARLAGLAGIVEWCWDESEAQNCAYMRVYLTEHAN